MTWRVSGWFHGTPDLASIMAADVSGKTWNQKKKIFIAYWSPARNWFYARTYIKHAATSLATGADTFWKKPGNKKRNQPNN